MGGKFSPKIGLLPPHYGGEVILVSPYFPPIWGGSKILKINFPPMDLALGGEVFTNFPPTLTP